MRRSSSGGGPTAALFSSPPDRHNRLPTLVALAAPHLERQIGDQLMWLHAGCREHLRDQQLTVAARAFDSHQIACDKSVTQSITMSTLG